MKNVIERWSTFSLSIWLILSSGCSSLSILRSTEHRVDAHTTSPSTTIRAQDGGFGNDPLIDQYEPARWATGSANEHSLANSSASMIQPVTNGTTPPAMNEIVYQRYPQGSRDAWLSPNLTPMRAGPNGPMGANVPTGSNHQGSTPPQMFLPLTLREAIESALSDSSVVRTLEGRVNVAQITPSDVEIAEWNVDAQRGQFQPRLSGNFDATKVNQPPNAFFGPGISADTQRDVVDAGISLEQPLTSGGLVSVGIEPATAYLYFPQGVGVGQFNPLYSTDYVIRVTQPLLRGSGSQTATAPIRIAQIQASASRHDLEEVLNSQIRSLTESYWRLYAAHMQVHAVRAVIPLAEESVRVENLRLKADRSILADVARAQVQLDGFRRTETTMLGELRKRVLQLRQLMGGQPMIEPLLLPAERPLEIPPPNDADVLIQTALQSRPALCAMRDRLNEKQQILGLANNAVLPTVDVRGEYRMNGLDENLDDAFSQAARNEYTDLTLGLVMNVPIGNKTARSQRHMAELDVARDRMRLSAMEQNVSFEVVELISDLEAAWQRMQIAKRQTQETQEWLRVSRIRYTQPPAANSSQDWLLLALTDLQSAMRASVDAISDLSEAVADYNTLVAQLHQVQGVSVYEWRQSQTMPLTSGGHAGLISTDYRSSLPVSGPRGNAPAINSPRFQTLDTTTNAGHAFGHLPLTRH